MTLNDYYHRYRLLGFIPTKNLPGSAIADIMLLRAKLLQPIAEHEKLMGEMTQKLRDDEKYALLKEEAALEYDKEGKLKNLEVSDDDPEDLREIKELLKDFNEVVQKMITDARKEDRYMPVGVLSEATYAAICDVVMPLDTLTSEPDLDGNCIETPVKNVISGLAVIMVADTKPKK